MDRDRKGMRKREKNGVAKAQPRQPARVLMNLQEAPSVTSSAYPQCSKTKAAALDRWTILKAKIASVIKFFSLKNAYCHAQIWSILIIITSGCWKGLLIPAGFNKSSKFWVGIFRNWKPSVLKCYSSYYLQMWPYQIRNDHYFPHQQDIGIKRWKVTCAGPRPLHGCCIVRSSHKITPKL